LAETLSELTSVLLSVDLVTLLNGCRAYIFQLKDVPGKRRSERSTGNDSTY